MAFNFSGISKTVGNFLPKASNFGKLSTVTDLLNPGKTRLNIAGLFPGGGSGKGKPNPDVSFQSSLGSGIEAEQDWRVRISLPDKSDIFYKDPGQLSNSMMEPLAGTNGVIFPYTPSITISHVANYTSVPLTHSNYQHNFFVNSDVSEFTITGEFTVQNADEGRYLMAAIYFFRSATKMFFGKGSKVGNPPPILFLDGYGSHYFPHVPVVITNFTHTIGSDVDYIEVPIKTTKLEEVEATPDQNNYGSVQNAEYVPDLLKGKPTKNTTPPGKKMAFNTLTSVTRLPTTSSVSVTLRPMYSRKNIHENFSLEDLSAGRLLGNKERGGFL